MKECRQHNSGIGGQAVLEGVMMRNKDQYAVAVRKPNQEIEIKVSEYKTPKLFKHLRKLPIFRGIFSFVDSLYLGMSTLMFSASFFEEEEEKKDAKEQLSEEEEKKLAAKAKKKEDAMMGGTVLLSIVMALLIFFALPYGLSCFFQRYIQSEVVIALIEGAIRLFIFIGYVFAISFMPDIQRVFMYHGA